MLACVAPEVQILFYAAPVHFIFIFRRTTIIALLLSVIFTLGMACDIEIYGPLDPLLHRTNLFVGPSLLFPHVVQDTMEGTAE